MPICMAIYIPLVMVRKIEVFAATHAFGDAMIIITLIVLFGYASASLANNGPEFSDIKPVGALWADAIGFSVYTYEGIGVILPIREVTADKQNYYKLLCITVTLIAMLDVLLFKYVLFVKIIAETCCFQKAEVINFIQNLFLKKE